MQNILKDIEDLKLKLDKIEKTLSEIKEFFSIGGPSPTRIIDIKLAAAKRAIELKRKKRL